MADWHLRLVIVSFCIQVSPVFAKPDGKFHPLVPGLIAEPLPVDLPNCNNVQYRHDGKLVALGYQGQLYLLSDSDGDGVEDQVDVFWDSEGREVGQIGMDLAPKGSPYGNAVFLCVKGKILMVADQDGDDKAEVVQTIAEGWPPARAGVDVTGLALHPHDGSVWFGLGVRLYNDAYEIEATGVAKNDLSGERGAIYRIAPDFKSREKICTGIRWPIALRFNERGDLFCTDQEGATWLPNGNPFDELLVIQKGRHYGFPPRHPTHLPKVIDEPSVFDYGPQHQSTCGMNFNVGVNGGPAFGPKRWHGDALVVGESRGKLYRTKVVPSEHGYVAHNELLACLGMLIIDVCVSPAGELRFCAHSGPPDWGTGPKGKGQLWRVRYEPDSGQQSGLAWRSTPNEVRVRFEGKPPGDWSSDEIKLEHSLHTRAGDRFETMWPGYEVLARQKAEGSQALEVVSTQFVRNNLVIKTTPLPEKTWLGFELPGGYALQADSSGVAVHVDAGGDRKWTSWVPHVDLVVSRELMGDNHYGAVWGNPQFQSRVTLETQLDLWQMLQPKIQKGAQLDYQYPNEIVTVTFSTPNRPFQVTFDGEMKESSQGQVTHDVSFTRKVTSHLPVSVSVQGEGVGIQGLTAYWSTHEDSRHRAFPRRRFLMPWVRVPAPRRQFIADRPEIRGGDWAKGRALFHGEKALCGKCHQVRGEGIHLGPDLTSLPFRDYASVWRDIVDPSASINPDYPTHQVELDDGSELVAVIRDQGNGRVRLGLGIRVVQTVMQDHIVKSTPLAHSLMPEGLDKALSEEERRDLMTFVLTEPLTMQDYSGLPRDGVNHPPKVRSWEELTAVLAGAPEPASTIRPIKVVLVAGPKDHGIGEHDYPRWQQVWGKLFALAEGVEIDTAWEWPSAPQWEQTDALVFFKRGDWSPDKIATLGSYLERGGGATFIHWACEAEHAAPALAELIGMASNRHVMKYRHGLLELSFAGAAEHPVARGFTSLGLHDESYWDLEGDPASLDVIALAPEKGEPRPLFWTRELQNPDKKHHGRVFVSIPGHYSRSFDDPLFRVLLLRGIAWSASEPVDRFNNLIGAGVSLGE